MGPDEIYLKILKELADAITKPSSMIVEWSWEPREVWDWKLCSDLQKDQEGGLWKLQAVILTSVLGKTIGEIILEGIEKTLGGHHRHQLQLAHIHKGGTPAFQM